MNFRNHILRSPDDDGGGGTAAPVAPAAPAPATTAAPAPATSAPAPAAPAPAGTPAAPPAGAPAPTNEGYWPADWRQTVSKADAKVLGRLERYASPEAAMQALIAAQNRISSGELKPVLGKNATPEQLKEWRDAHGIPETPDKYDLGKDTVKGIAPAFLSKVLAQAHATNQTPEQVKATLKGWGEITQEVQAQRVEKDMEIQKTGEDLLRAEWGGEYRRNINLIHGMLDGAASPDLKDALLSGRMADGTPIGSSPDMLKFLVGLSLIQNPTGVVVPAGEGNLGKGIEDRIAEIEKMMRTDRKAYNDPKISGPGGEYGRLLEAREKMKPRTSA